MISNRLYHIQAIFPANTARGFKSQVLEYLVLGVPEEWIEPLKALGYDTIDKIKALEKPGKLHQEMMGYRKKNKLEIGTLTMEQVSEWIS